MGFWDWITGGSPYPEVRTGVDVMAGVKEPWYGESEQWYAEPKFQPSGYEALGPTLREPWYGPEEQWFPPERDWKGSLWSAFKGIAGAAAGVAGEYLKMKRGDQGALLFQQNGAVGEREREDWKQYTDYQRRDSGSQPSPVILGGKNGGLGIPPALLIGGLALLFIMRRKKK